MSTVRQQIEGTIAGLESQRALLGDAVVDAAVVPLRSKLAALASAQRATGDPFEQTLKQVSVLFLDVVGSTTMGRRLDPEGVHEVMDGALTVLTSIVDAHRGRVLSYAGDNLLAVFGAPDASEDDPERAVRAGLALLAAVPPIAESVKARHDLDGFNVRVGMESSLIRLTCYQVLQRAGDSRAAEVLAGAHVGLQSRAATITDTALCHGFLNNIPEHRAIVAAWAAHPAECAGGH